MRTHLFWLAFGATAFLPVAARAEGNDPGRPEAFQAFQALQVTVGPWTLLDTELREALGTGLALELSYAGQLGRGEGPWLEVGAGYCRSAGPLGDPDPTFETPEAVAELIPFAIGLRNLVGREPDVPLRLYIGAGAIWAIHRWKAPFEDTSSSSTLGGYVELRPELRLRPGVHVWLRQRLHVLSDNRFGDLVEVNPSGFALTLGLRYDIAGNSRSPQKGAR